MAEDLALARALLALLPHLGQIMAKSARQAGTLSVDRVKPLGILSRAAPIHPGELAELCYLTPAAVTHAIDALVADGLARREPDPADRRAILLHVTAKGRRELSRVEQRALSSLARRLDRLDPATLAALRGALPKLERVLAPSEGEERKVSDVH